MKLLFAEIRIGLLLMLLACVAVSCRDSLAESGIKGPSLALSLKNVRAEQSAATKMATDVTQTNGFFRGIEQVYIIPFSTNAAPVQPGDSRLGGDNVILANAAIGVTGLVANNNSRLFDNVIMPMGMDRVLAYGKAPDEGEGASKSSKHRYGSLIAKGLDNPSGADAISFSLEPILSTGENGELSELFTRTDEILEKLNDIIYLIRQSNNTLIQSIYHTVKRENQIQSCSYVVFDRIRTEIQTALLAIPNDASVINDKIQINLAVNTFSSVLSSVGTTFPASYGIPDGAMGFWWNGEEFVRLIGGVNIALVDPASYCYPPCLWYFANSPLQTTISDEFRTQYVPGNAEWDDILAFYSDGHTVHAGTHSAAIVDPLQYGVGMMELSLGTPDSEVSALAYGCPLTGIIIGDQKNVDFRFQPVTAPAVYNPARYIYDNITGELKIGKTDASIQTLVLQTIEDATIHFALEFQNNTSTTLHCQQGDILPWSKFYLAGELNPHEGTQPEGESQTLMSTFYKDRKTSVSIRIKSIRNAYNTVPDLHDPQLEIGIVTEMKWTPITPQSIILHL